MNKFLLGVVGLVAMATTASAADLAARPYTKAPPPIVAVAYNWSGFYIGAHGGYGWGTSNWLNTASNAAGPFWPGLIPGDRTSHSISGGLGGGQIGYNFQAGAVVYGVELSGSAADIRGSSIAQLGPFSEGDDVFTTKISSLFLASARLGYAANNWLFYAKGGYAGANVKTSAVDTTPPLTGSGFAQTWHNGWNVGGGIEYGLSPNWSVALQYDYVRLETQSVNLGGPNFFNGVAAGTAIYNWNVSPHDIQAVTARINYRFGGPVIARY
jgi:outer membrane immunogenic protein